MAIVFDINVIPDGTVWLFRLNTIEAAQWVAENLELEDWQWTSPPYLGDGDRTLYGSFAVDHRPARVLAEQIKEEGLQVFGTSRVSGGRW